jgi:hypothetical protein
VRLATGQQALRHAHTARLAGVPQPALGAVLLEHPQPAAYCVAGRQPTVVLTTGALQALSPDQRSSLRRTRQLASARTRPSRRDDLPLRLPQPLRSPCVQRRPAPRQLPVPPGGRVTFLDFGLVKYFTAAEQPLLQMARNVCVEHDPEAFRRNLENAGFLRPHAPLSTQAIAGHLDVFYDTIREPGPLTITSDYASSVVRRFFDLRSPAADHISVPQSYMVLQRINLGLFAYSASCPPPPTGAPSRRKSGPSSRDRLRPR